MPSAQSAVKLARKLKQLAKVRNAIVEGSRVLKPTERIAYHSTNKAAAAKIEKEGIIPIIARMSKAEAKAFNEELLFPARLGDADKYTDYVYSSLSKHAGRYAPGGREALFRINLGDAKLRAKTLVDPKHEGGLLTTRGHIPKKLLKRILGIGGAVGGMAVLDRDEAQAMPNLIKPAGQAIKGAITSSTKRLKGSKIFGRVVKEVRAGQNKGWRNVIFETGEQRAFTVQEMNDLNRKVGDDFYRQKFKDAGAATKRQQALKSLQYHFDRSPMKPGHSNVLGTMDLTERQLMLHKGRLRELAPELDRGTLKFVKTTEFGAQEVGGHFSAPMPAEYADELEKLDFVEIIDYRTKRINK